MRKSMSRPPPGIAGVSVGQFAGFQDVGIVAPPRMGAWASYQGSVVTPTRDAHGRLGQSRENAAVEREEALGQAQWVRVLDEEEIEVEAEARGRRVPVTAAREEQRRGRDLGAQEREEIRGPALVDREVLRDGILDRDGAEAAGLRFVLVDQGLAGRAHAQHERNRGSSPFEVRRGESVEATEEHAAVQVRGEVVELGPERLD